MKKDLGVNLIKNCNGIMYNLYMKILLIDNGTTLLDKLEAIIPGNEIVVRFDKLDGLHEEEFDALILSGGSSYVLTGNEDKFQKEMDLIRHTKRPIIGICFGCELIAKAFGGTLKKLEKINKGVKEITISTDLLPNKSNIKVYESHEWGIDRLPETFDIWGSSKDGPEIIKHRDLSIYGLQFHPENLLDETDGDDVFKKIFSEISANVIE